MFQPSISCEAHWMNCGRALFLSLTYLRGSNNAKNGEEDVELLGGKMMMMCIISEQNIYKGLSTKGKGVNSTSKRYISGQSIYLSGLMAYHDSRKESFPSTAPVGGAVK